MDACVFDVTKFGAKGNGINNDWEAIQEAAEAAIANDGGTIWFPNCFTFLNRAQGQHGLLLRRSMNIRVMMGFNTRYIQDNMNAQGKATAHGIFVSGASDNIILETCDVRYKTFSTGRQTWAPVFAIGDNISVSGTGEGAWHRGEAGGENPALIAAGAINNFQARNCYTENSPSVMIGVAGVNGSYIQNFRSKKSWADGLYHLYVREAIVVGAHLEQVSDDGLSISSYESNTGAADINNSFHGENSVFTGITINGIGIGYDGFPSGGIALLGCRNLTIGDFAIKDKFRGLRFEYGTALSTDFPFLSTLANRDCTIANGTIENGFHVIAGINKEVDFGSDPKWFDNKVLIQDVISGVNNNPFGVNADHPQGQHYPLNAYGDAQDTGNTIPAIMQGFTLRGCTFLDHTPGGYQLGRGNVIEDCEFEAWSFNGYAPYRGDIENAAYPPNNCQLRNIRGKDLSFVGVKNCNVEIHSENADKVGVGVYGCADIHFEGITVKNTNRSAGTVGVGGVVVDEYSLRITCKDFDFEQDNVDVANALSINSIANHYFSRVIIRTQLNTFYRMVFDRRFTTERISQVGILEWFHQNSFPQQRTLQYRENQIGIRGNESFEIFPENNPRIYLLDFPYTEERTIIVHENPAGMSDVIEILRTENATGAHDVIIQGQALATPEVAAKSAIGTFLITGGTYDPGVNQIVEVRVNGVNILPAPINWGAPDFFNNNNDYTANQIVLAIHNAAGTYDAEGSQDLVSIIAPPGAAYNGQVLTFVLTGDVTVGDVNNLSGGLNFVPQGAMPPPYDITVLPAEKTGCRIVLTSTRYRLLESTVLS